MAKYEASSTVRKHQLQCSGRAGDIFIGKEWKRSRRVHCCRQLIRLGHLEDGRLPGYHCREGRQENEGKNSKVVLCAKRALHPES